MEREAVALEHWAGELPGHVFRDFRPLVSRRQHHRQRVEVTIPEVAHIPLFPLPPYLDFRLSGWWLASQGHPALRCLFCYTESRTRPCCGMSLEWKSNSSPWDHLPNITTGLNFLSAARHPCESCVGSKFRTIYCEGQQTERQILSQINKVFLRNGGF